MWDSTCPLTWYPISGSHVGDPHVDNHVELRRPRDRPSSSGVYGTHPSRDPHIGNHLEPRDLPSLAGPRGLTHHMAVQYMPAP
ncbi:hypothetical protein DVH24_011867 [Malus domestica]|uniref:Uncharacterized protein n=1 Tax=Malus domestica TaxID=3750 RepID=A0A498JG63_MALDO|nr:hypothetical protein DVH24_011867 [Malus domestica]